MYSIYETRIGTREMFLGSIADSGSKEPLRSSIACTVLKELYRSLSLAQFDRRQLASSFRSRLGLLMTGCASLAGTDQTPSIESGRETLTEQADYFVPMTNRERWDHYAYSLVEPQAFLYPAVQAGLNQARNGPHEWGQSVEGYGHVRTVKPKWVRVVDNNLARGWSTPSAMRGLRLM